MAQFDVAYEDALAATCPHFVSLHITEIHDNYPEIRHAFYLIDSERKKIRIGTSEKYDDHSLKYIADSNFVTKYSVLYELGDVFEWELPNGFMNWIQSLLAQTPTFIQPYHRSTRALMLNTNLAAITYEQSCWFSYSVDKIYPDMFVEIPEAMKYYIKAPNQAVAIVHSGSEVWYVKIQNLKLTTGWFNVIHDHNMKNHYLVLFACVGHLEFEIFVFDEEHAAKYYDWNTVLPIKYSRAPTSWDSEIEFRRLAGGNVLTACPPKSFRASPHALRCFIPIESNNLDTLLLPYALKKFCEETGDNIVTLVIHGAQWHIKYKKGYLYGDVWETFLAVYNLEPGHLLIITPDIKHHLHAMVVQNNGCEQIYSWYSIPYDEDPFDL